MAHQHQTALIMLTTKWVRSFSVTYGLFWSSYAVLVFLKKLHTSSAWTHISVTIHLFFIDGFKKNPALCSLCFLWILPNSKIAGTPQPGPPGRQLGHYPSLPPGYQNTSVSHGAMAPMHPAMQATTQPYSQAPQPYQQVRKKRDKRWLMPSLFGLLFLIHSFLRWSVNIYCNHFWLFHSCSFPLS